MKKLISLILLAGTAVFAQTAAPVWFKVAAGGDAVAASKGMTLRYGMGVSTYAIATGGHAAGDASAAAWSSPVTLSADATISDDDTFFAGDPAYGVYKEVDVQQTAVSQVVWVTPAGSTKAVPVVVPALPGTVSMPAPGGLPMGCQSGLVSSKDGSGNVLQEYFYMLCANAPR
jgi:hypothetical protein